MTGVSVLMSLYWKERPECLRESLDSVMGQTLQADEIVMVIDGSIGGELEAVLDDYPQLRLVRLPRNMGLGAALREGLKHCRCGLVARMDTDDVCKPNRFELQVSFMRQHPEVSALSCWIDEFTGHTGNVVSVRRLPETHEELAGYCRMRSPMNHPAVMFRKEAVERVGSYMHFPLFEDYYLWARLISGGYRLHNLQQSLLWFRTTDDTFRRRGGWKYACGNARFQWTMYRLGITSLPMYVAAAVGRGVVFVMPNGWREWVYRRLLR